MFNKTSRRLISHVLVLALAIGGFVATGDEQAAAVPVVSNDNIAQAILLDRDDATTTLTTSNTNASLEENEELLVPRPRALWTGSLWYKMSPSTAGVVEFNTTGSNFDTILAVYTFTDEDDFSTFTEIAYNDDNRMSLLSSVDFRVDGVSTYFIVVAGFPNNTGDITLNWRVPESALNDDIVDAIDLNVAGPEIEYFNNFDATEETDEVTSIQASNIFNRWENSVWFKVQPTEGWWGIELYAPRGANLVVLDSQAFEVQSIKRQREDDISFHATGGVFYYIGIAGPEQSFYLNFRSAVQPSMVRNVTVTRGTITEISWTAPEVFDQSIHSYFVQLTNGNRRRTCISQEQTSCLFPRLGNGTWELDIYAQDSAVNLEGVHVVDPSVEILNTSNDYFASATSLLIDDGQVDDFLDFATLESNEPSHAETQTSSSVWYTYAPTTTGTSTVSIAETNLEMTGDIFPVVSVFTGDQISNLQRVASSARSVSWESRSNQRYYIAVSSIENFADLGSRNPSFNFRLTWSHVAAPPPVVETPSNPPTTPSTPKVTTVKVKNNATMASILKKAKIKPPKNSKVTYKIATSSKKLCSISSSKMKFKKKGTCSLTVKVKPKKGATASYLLAVTN